jgi:3-phenylpropionate/cinnamic acid dioxygenase small subunit
MGDATEITNLLYRYAELMDAARFDDVGELMAHCTFFHADDHTPLVSGAEAIAGHYRSVNVVHADGTLRTKHVTTNPIIEIDDDTATVRSMYTVLQQTDELPLQPIIAGRYHDRFARLDGAWAFTQRRFFVDLVGDLRHHLTFELPPDPPVRS